MNNFEHMVHTLDGYVMNEMKPWGTDEQYEQEELLSLATVESVMLPGIVVSKKVYKTKRKIVWEATDIA
jgi:hypothetical protein